MEENIVINKRARIAIDIMKFNRPVIFYNTSASGHYLTYFEILSPTASIKRIAELANYYTDVGEYTTYMTKEILRSYLIGHYPNVAEYNMDTYQYLPQDLHEKAKKLLYVHSSVIYIKPENTLMGIDTFLPVFDKYIVPQLSAQSCILRMDTQIRDKYVFKVLHEVCNEEKKIIE